MKKVISLCIALMLFVTLFSVSVSAAENCVYLSDIEMASYTKRNDNWVPGIDLVSYHKKVISIGGKTFSKGISMHPLDAGEGKESECVWDISAYDYNCFKAVIGKDDAGKSGLTEAQLKQYEGTKASFFVYFDDVLTYEKVVAAGTAEEIEVAIPSGTKKIKLMLGDGGDGIYCDVSDFADARLCNVNGQEEEKIEMQDVVYVSDIPMKSFTKRNDNWIPGVDIVAYHKTKINVNGTPYDKGITMHPLDAGEGKESECVWDISGYSQKYFYAVIGKDAAGLKGLTASQVNQYASTKASFYVYFDNNLAYEKVVLANTAQVVNIEIPAGTKLLTFKLGDGGDGIFCDISSFADAKLYNIKKTAPTQDPDPTPTQAPSQDPTQAPTSAPTAAPTDDPQGTDAPKPTEAPVNPKTGDSSMLFIGFAVIAVISLFTIFYLQKKKA